MRHALYLAPMDPLRNGILLSIEVSCVLPQSRSQQVLIHRA